MAVRYSRLKEMPSKLLCTPESQAKAVSVVIETYQKWNEHRCPEALLTDFLTDLLHWADQNRIYFPDALAIATRHYELERQEHEDVVEEVRAEKQQQNK